MNDADRETTTAVDEAPATRSLAIGWERVVVVCRQCQRRGSGPSRLKAKAVAAVLRLVLRRSPVRTRIALTGCLGPCPKKAITVAAPSPDGGGGAGAWAVRTREEARSLGRQLSSAPASRASPAAE